DATGVLSALRGYSLGRNMYGYADGILNEKPYNGTGRLHNTGAAVPAFFTQPAPNYTPVPLLQDEIALMNYQYHKADDFLRDPERPGFRPDKIPTEPDHLKRDRTFYIGGFNVPYTYPDHNNFYLAKIDPNTGQV